MERGIEMKHSTETRWQMFYQCQREEEAHRKMEKKVLLVASLFLLFVGMSVAVLGQNTSEFWSFRQEIPIPMSGELPLHEIAKRYGINEAVEMAQELDRTEEARREIAKIKAAQWRDRELRKKVAELANASLKLYQRFSNPTVVHTDTPELAKKCEKLAKDIKRFLR